MNDYLQKMFTVEGKVVAVTGGCGGIGMGLCEELLKAGAQVAVVDYDASKIDSTVQELQSKTGGTVRGYRCNITDEASVREAFAGIDRDFGSVYGLINCAGISHVEYLSTMSIDKWQAVMDVNLRGTVLCTKVAGEYMAKDRVGRVINISSLAATHGKPQYCAYTPSKAAVNGFTFTLAAEWAHKGITVNGISPVLVVTNINRHQVESDPAYLQRVLHVIPQGRLCSPQLLVGTVIFLLSDASSFVTGQIIGCDGGSQNGDVGAFVPEEYSD